MRDVKSKRCFEQMKGRGTRTLDHDSLKKVFAAPLDAQGGPGKMHQLFGDQMHALIDELNRELVA